MPRFTVWLSDVDYARLMHLTRRGVQTPLELEDLDKISVDLLEQVAGVPDVEADE